jgi:small conductance mechanosensitive channel
MKGFWGWEVAGAILLMSLWFSGLVGPLAVLAQGEADDPLEVVTTPVEGELVAPEIVAVEPLVQDDQISQRLVAILQATGWFTRPAVAVQDGVVFLDGRTLREEHREWAGNLARNTEAVVAVVNRIQVIERSPWDFSPAWAELRRLARATVQTLPLILFCLLVLGVAWLAARGTARLARHLLRERIPNPFLRDLTATLLSIPIVLLALYLILQTVGLTRLALTVLGGTGLAGLIIGIAFRDIVENFLASILISTRTPFVTGDWIEVAGYNGLVQQVTTRGTMLLTFDGHYVRIPNATVYKSNIVNYSANPQRRLDFTIGISYGDSIAAAQEIIRAILAEHPAVLAEPEPLVLVEKLGVAAVELRIYFWYHTAAHNGLRVKSSLIRLAKHGLEEAGFSFPSPAREVVFPRGVPVWLIQEDQTTPAQAQRPPTPATAPEPATVATAAEGDLQSEEAGIQAQARQARPLDEGENLLRANGVRS